MNYQLFAKPPAQTPQCLPIPGRAAEMGQGGLGDWRFKAASRQMVRYAAGNLQGSFYAGKHELTNAPNPSNKGGAKARPQTMLSLERMTTSKAIVPGTFCARSKDDIISDCV